MSDPYKADTCGGCGISRAYGKLHDIHVPSICYNHIDHNILKCVIPLTEIRVHTCKEKLFLICAGHG